MGRRRWLLWVAALTFIPLLMLSACKAGGPSPAQGTPSSGPVLEPGQSVRLSLALGPSVTLAEAEVPVSGGTIAVERFGDPLDGLTIDVPEGCYGETVGFDVSYRPVTEVTGVGDAVVLSPLIDIDNGGAVAQDAVALTIPVKVPEHQFPMAYYYDEATGSLEGVPVLGFSDEAVTLATQHFSTLIITALDYAALEHMEVDTGFVPGKDTWQFQNQGTYLAPDGICWGMSVSSLWYYLEEPWQVSGQRLWGAHDNSLGDARKTLDYWQDDDWGLKIATAIQMDFDRARRDRSHDVVYQLEQELAGTGTLLDLRLSKDQITFYSLVSALATTNEPQLVNVSTADRKRAHSLIAYKLEGTTVYVADPNDYQANPPQRTLVLTDGAFGVYTASENLLDQLAGIQSGYTEVSYWGQSALTHWQQVGRLWSQGDRLPVDLAYRLRVVERDAGGAVTDEYDLDPLNPLRTTQEELELHAVASGATPLRASLMLFDHRDVPIVDGPLPLAPGENLVGVYVEGDADWVDSGGRPKTGWRWLGFDWITVIREEVTPTATATAEADATATTTATPAVTPTATPQPVARAFVDADCVCAGLGVPSATVESTSEGPYLQCSISWPVGEFQVTLLMRGEDTANSAAMLQNLSHQLGLVCDGVAACTDQHGVHYRTLDSNDVMYTRISGGPRAESRWLGHRGLIYRDRFYLLINPSVPGPSSEDAILTLLDQAEICARAAVDRYLGE
ncbi:MAG: hypothetical protein ACYCYF_03265 [Anaerolineae bacterium]